MNIKCENCGQTYSSELAFCSNCAQANRYYKKPTAQDIPNHHPSFVETNSTTTQSYRSPNIPNVNDEGDTFGYAIIGFLFGFVGLIVYFALKDSRPKAAQSALNGFWLSIGFYVLAILFTGF
jgi:hypothetical protein